jgi:hypothetical protein
MSDKFIPLQPIETNQTDYVGQPRKANVTYQHRTQKPSLCGPTSLQMILESHGVTLDQEAIAREIGVKVAEHELEAFDTPLPVGHDQKELGIGLHDFESQRIKEFLIGHNLPLMPKVYMNSQIEDLGAFIFKNLQQGNDVMVDIWMAHYKEDLQMGHYALVSAIDGDMVTLCDPWPTTEPFWKTSVTDLAKSMDASHDGQERGIVVFTKQY